MSRPVRIATRRLLIDEWGDPAAIGGYTPDMATQLSDQTRVRIHLGEFDDDRGFPQITLTDVSSTARNPSGYYATKADGSGFVQKFDGRIDIQVHAGSRAVVSDPDELAYDLGEHVRRIIHGNNGALVNSSGEMLAENIAPMTQPMVMPDTDYEPTRYSATVETGYESAFDPPR